MANALHRDIEEGERVIIRADILRPQYRDIDNRVFVCLSGSGMVSWTMGTAVFGYFLKEGPQSEARFEGYEIDADATAKFQAEG